MSEEAIKQILLEIEKENAVDETGELREGLRNTPKRVVESWAELYSGYKQNPKETLNATFNGETILNRNAYFIYCTFGYN